MAARGAPEVPAEPYPGQRLGLPASGRGSLAGWRIRMAALLLDWAASMGVAVAIFGGSVVTGSGWQAWMILATFFVESTLLVTLASGSFGQLVCRIAVVRRRAASKKAALASSSKCRRSATCGTSGRIRVTAWP